MKPDVGGRLRRLSRFGFATMLTWCCVAGGIAQYNVHQWGSFEDGRLPAACHVFGTDAEHRIRAVDLAAVPGMASEFRNARASSETGRYGLLMHIDPGADPKVSYTNGIVLNAVLDRDLLGARGRAIYQADIFLPPLEQFAPIAVLAAELTEPKDGKYPSPRTFYRFGITSNKELYFSLAEPGKAAATIMKTDQELLAHTPLPGWHRFSIVFDGKDAIRCFVDGREASFSPVTDTKLTKLAIGVMLATKSKVFDAYVDNLSIQFTQDAEVMPISPYSEGWKFPAGPVSMRGATMPAAVVPTAPGGGQWLEPAVAWTTAQRENRPLFLYFYSPGASATEELEGIFRTNADAQSFVGKCACTRIDVNQLQGGMAARQYNVFKVPTLFLISSDAKSYKRSIFRRGEKWEKIVGELTAQP